MGAVAPIRLARQHELRVKIADDEPARNRPQPDLRPAQVLQHRELNPLFAGDPADQIEGRGVIVMRAVREIQPEDIRTGVDHAAEDKGIARCGAQSRHDLGPHLSNGFFVIRLHVASLM